MEIDDNGTIRIRDEGGLIGTGQLNGKNFSFTVPAIGSQAGVSCSGTQSFDGVVNETGTITGNISGKYTCQQQGRSLPISLRGTYSVSRARTAAPAMPRGGYSDGVMDLMRRLMQ